MNIKNKIGSLRNRIEQRIGRSFGECDSCGKPTRSHRVGTRLVCHDCHTDNQPRLVTDGGWKADKQEQQTPIGGDEIPETMRQRDEWFNFILEVEAKDNGETKIDKSPVSPFNGGDLYWANWVTNKEEDRTDFETANKFASLGREGVGRLKRHPDTHLADYTIGLAYPIPNADHRDPSESVTLIDLDDVRNPDDGALHPRAIELIEEANSFAQVSSSGTGIHILVLGALPDDVSTIDDSLPDHDAFPDAEIEVYDNGRFIAMTGDRVEGTPTEVYKREDLLADLADEFDANESSSEDFDPEPEFDKEHVSNVQTTDNIREIISALRHLKLRDYRHKSTITEERADGSLSLDPSWERSDSGTRIGYFNDNDGPPFVYRKGDEGFGHDAKAAAEAGIIPDPTHSLKGEDWWQAIEQLRKMGADIPEYDRTTGILNQAAMWPEIHREDTTPTITRQNHYDLVYREIEDAMAAERNVLIDAIMSSGKTYNSFKAAFDRSEQIAYFAPRRPLCEQAKNYALDNGYDESDILILPSLFEDCPTAAGEHGCEWESKIEKQYEQGATPADIHAHNDNIPCHDHDDDGKTCAYKQFFKEHDIEDYDVVIGHHKHSHLPQVTKNRHNVFDEYPGDSFTTHLGGEQLIRGINAFLDMDGSPPVDDFTELLEIRNDEMKKRRAMGWFNNHELGSESHKVIDNYEQGFHAKAPHAVYAILKAKPNHEGSNFEHAFMPGVDNHAQVFTTSEQHGEFYVEIRNTPDLSYANSVIALDGTPLAIDSDRFKSEVAEWNKTLGVTLDHEKILSDEERATYLTDTLNHTYITTTSALKPYSSGRYNNAVQDEILCREVTERHGNGKPPVVVSSKKVCDEYESAGFVDDGIVDDFEYPGNLRGSNEYADTRVAVQLGSSHHGDHEIARRAAWLGADIDPEGRGKDRDYGSEIGNKILEQMREKQTLQNILRFGRDGGGATIILHTSAYPDWLPIAGHGKIDSWSEGMREVVEAWQDLPAVAVTASDVADHDAVSVSDRRVRSLLSMLAEDHGLVEQEKGEGANGAHLYADAGVKDLERTELAEVDLPEVDDEELAEMGLLDDDGEPIAESVEISRYSINTSNFRVHGSEGGGLAVKTGYQPNSGVAEGGDGAQRE